MWAWRYRHGAQLLACAQFHLQQPHTCMVHPVTGCCYYYLLGPIYFWAALIGDFLTSYITMVIYSRRTIRHEKKNKEDGLEKKSYS